MGTKTIVAGLVVVGVGGEVLYDNFDRATNYTKVSGVVEKIDDICTVESSKGKLVDRETEELKYFDCEIAAVIAPMRGFSKHNINKHQNVIFSYVSPIDSSKYSGSRVIKFYDNEEYEVGKETAVYASNTEPSKVFTRR